MFSESKIMVRYAETDKMGIVHHSHYAVWFEVGRTDLSKLIGLPYRKMEKMGIGLPLLELHCNFRQTATYDDELTIRTRICRLTAAKIQFAYEIFKQGIEKPICSGYTLHGIVDRLTMRPLNFKKKFPEAFDLFQRALEA